MPSRPPVHLFSRNRSCIARRSRTDPNVSTCVACSRNPKSPPPVLLLMNPTKPPRRRTTAFGLPILAAVCLALVVGAITASATAPGTRYSGRATGVFIHTALLDTSLADTGDLPPEGGAQDGTLVQVDTSLAKADVLLSITMGMDGRAQSEAATATVDLLPGSTNEVKAEFVLARSTATCSGVSGFSEIANLQVGGESVTVGTTPNQVLTVPGVLTLVINEQTDRSHDGTFDMTVNAPRLTLETGEEVIVSHAHSDIACGEEAPVLKDFVTGGGFIETSSGTANFGFVAGLKPGASVASGHLTYIDHASGMKVKATDINNDYDGSGATRTFSGLATVNGVSGYTFKVTVTDNGEPGRGVDTFYIVLSTGYEAGGTLAGGNIQLHA